jgi:hypothetical protein
MHVIEVLARYDLLGASLGWSWPSGRRYSVAFFAEPKGIEEYELGRRIPVYVLLRDLGCDKASLSRALTSLDRQGLVWRYGGDAELAGTYTWNPNCKFARITSEGHDWLKRQLIHSGKVDAYQVAERHHEASISTSAGGAQIAPERCAAGRATPAAA